LSQAESKETGHDLSQRSGAYNLPHAELHTVILPHGVAFNQLAVPAIMEQVVRAMGIKRAATGLYDLASSKGHHSH
jgi:alcohol dehydrogenase class IV